MPSLISRTDFGIDKIVSLDVVHNASYKEIPFTMEGNTVTGGRKDAVHSYANSENQIVEDLGLKRRSYSVRAIIYGAKYYSKRDAFLTALEDPTPGTLVHPFYGALENYKAREYTLEESFDDYGIAKFNITFDFSAPLGTKAGSPSTFSEVEKSARVARDFTKDALGKLKVPKLNAFQKLFRELGRLTDQFNSASRSIGGIVANINQYTSQITAFSGSLAALILTPAKLAGSISDLFVSMRDIFDAPRGALNAMIQMFDPIEDEIKSKYSTVNNSIGNSNTDLLNSTVQEFALIEAYRSIALSDFATLDELAYHESLLEVQYQKLMASGDSLTRDCKFSLTNLRTITNKVLDATKTTLPNIITVDILNPTPLRVLEFNYYGNNDQTGDLRIINSNRNESFCDGEVNIVNNVTSGT